MARESKRQFDDVLEALEPAGKLDFHNDRMRLEKAFDMMYWHGKSLMIEKADDGTYQPCSGAYDTSFREISPLEGKVADFRFNIRVNAEPKRFRDRESTVRMSCYLENEGNNNPTRLASFEYSIISRPGNNDHIVSRKLYGDINRMLLDTDFMVPGECDLDKYRASARSLFSLFGRRMDGKHKESYRAAYDTIMEIPYLVDKRILNR